MSIDPASLTGGVVPAGGDALNWPVLPPVPAGKRRRAADQIADILVQNGVKTVFGLPGGAISPIYDALMDHPEVRVVTCKHETMAVFAAAAYARATDGVGVVLVTSGPGVTNAVTGLASAYCDSLPVVLLAGEVPRAQFGRGALQEGSAYSLDVRGMVSSITKATYELTNPQSAASLMSKALATARSGRKGPVFVSLPLDVTRQQVDPPRIGAQVSAQFTVEAPLLDEVADLLAGAERPLILAGSGARWGAGPQQLLRLAERGGIPVATTPKAKGVFPESHSLALGVYGLGGHASASGYLDAGVDVLVAVGAGFGEVSTNTWTDRIKASKAFIQLDIDAGQIGKNYRADIGLVGPAEILLRQLLERLPKARHLALVQRVKRDEAEHAGAGALGPIKPQRALWELQQKLPSDAIFTVDIGDHMVFALHHLQLDRPDCFYYAPGLGSMGSGLGAALGVQLADTDRTVVCVCGDGTISMCGTELLTASQQGLPIVYAVLNDGGYGMVDHGFQNIYGRSMGFSLEPLNLAGFAEQVGARSVIVQRAKDILNVDFAAARAERRPLLLDIRTGGATILPFRDRIKEVV
ncbi:MAG: thiamine pyrophosphate-binding protein [Myxococcales bacterium]